MTNRKTRLAAMVAAVSLSALGVAYAATDSSKEHEDEKAEIAFVLSAKHSLIDAVKTAEARANGVALEAALEIEDGKTFYEVETLSKDGVYEARIDANTGVVIAADREDDGDDENLVRSKTTESMVGAIQKAEAKTGAKAMEAELDDENGKLVFEIELASANGVQTVGVDAMTGAVIDLKPEAEDEKSDN